MGEFVLDKEEFQKDLPPETIHRPVLPDPVQTDEVLKPYGYARYSSKHLLLITDIEPESVRGLERFLLEHLGPNCNPGTNQIEDDG